MSLIDPTNPSLLINNALSFFSMYAPPVFWLLDSNALKISEIEIRIAFKRSGRMAISYCFR